MEKVVLIIYFVDPCSTLHILAYIKYPFFFKFKTLSLFGICHLSLCPMCSSVSPNCCHDIFHFYKFKNLRVFGISDLLCLPHALSFLPIAISVSNNVSDVCSPLVCVSK